MAFGNDPVINNIRSNCEHFKMYIVAEFEDEMGMAVVRESWLTPLKREVYWPPYKQRTQYIKALKSDEEIKETWQCYKIRRIFYETSKIFNVIMHLQNCRTQNNT